MSLLSLHVTWDSVTYSHYIVRAQRPFSFWGLGGWFQPVLFAITCHESFSTRDILLDVCCPHTRPQGLSIARKL